MDNSQIRILVAEDEDALRRMLVMIFEDEGYQVDAAADGKQAWDLMNTNHHDLLATDMFMPHMNGIDLLLNCNKSFPATKTILFSGGGRGIKAEHGDKHVTFEDQSIDVDIFMKKPCSLTEMLLVVEALLEGKPITLES